MKNRTVLILLSISVLLAGIAIGRMINNIVAPVSNNENVVVPVDPVAKPSNPAIKTPTMPSGGEEEDGDDEYEDEEEDEDDD